MNNNKSILKNFKLLSLIAVLLIVIGVAGAWLVGESGGSAITLEETISVANVDHVQIRTRNQRVRVHPTNDSEAKVVSTGMPANATLTVEVINNVLTIETRVPRQIIVGVNFSSFRSLTDPPALAVYLPENVYEQVTINSTNGRVEVSGLAITDLQIETTNGSIELNDIAGNVDVQTSNGRIRVSGITGDEARFRTTNGGMELADITNHITGQTTNGRITFNHGTIEQNVDLQSTNGRIEVQLAREPEHAAFDLRTTNSRTEIFGNNNSTQQFGDGRYEVTLRTTNGRITVE